MGGIGMLHDDVLLLSRQVEVAAALAGAIACAVMKQHSGEPDALVLLTLASEWESVLGRVARQASDGLHGVVGGPYHA